MNFSSRFFWLLFFTAVLSKKLQESKPKPRVIRYQPWNTKMYPVWKQGDPRYRSSWTGGEVKFDVGNDSPTLSGAHVTFTIDIIIPDHQVALPDGEVVWGKNCSVNGTQRQEGEPVYPRESVDDQDAVFPDGSPLSGCENQKPAYVFVWKTCGKYWQVCDGLLSSLSISTEGIPLGSSVMDVVIYQYRKKDKFIPIGYASTQYCITDQIPFDVTLTQVRDKDEGDQTFTQNHPVAFAVAIHDPSSYLAISDVTFNWDFGDASGAVISREPTVTHTYTKTGFFMPHVVVQAVIPNPSCSTTPNTPPSTADAVVSQGHGGSLRFIATVRNVEAVYQDTTVMKRDLASVQNSDRDCVVYRYGSFSTQITVVEDIQDVQMDEKDGQRSLPTDICAVMSDCISPGDLILPECMSVLRRMLQDLCVNVSMSNYVHLSVTGSRVDVNAGSRFFLTGLVAIVLGVLMVALSIWTFACKHKKLSQPPSEISATGITCATPSRLWSLVKEHVAPQRSSVLLQQA